MHRDILCYRIMQIVHGGKLRSFSGLASYRESFQVKLS